MFNKLLRNKKGQNTAEYAILISLVVAGIIAMQTYAQRALQARVRGAGQYLTDSTTSLGAEYQYEPYYLSTDYTSTRDDTSTVTINTEATNAQQKQQDTSSTRTGSSTTSYSAFGLVNGV